MPFQVGELVILKHCPPVFVPDKVWTVKDIYSQSIRLHATGTYDADVPNKVYEINITVPAEDVVSVSDRCPCCDHTIGVKKYDPTGR